MIKYLNGMKETVDFDELPTFLLHDNTDIEEYPSHWHAPIEIIMPLENSYTISCEGKPYLLEVNDVLIVAPGVVHKCHASKGRRLILQVDLSRLLTLEDFNSNFKNIGQVMLISSESHPEILEQCSSLMLDIMKEYFSNNIAKDCAIASDVLKLLCIAFRTFYTPVAAAESHGASKHQMYMEVFDKIKEYTLEHCTENITLEEIAEKSGFSKFYFSRTFKEYSGTSYYKFLNICRINYSAELLIDPEMSITEVAINSGFNSISSFIRMFKQIKGCTPTDYRKMHEMILYE